MRDLTNKEWQWLVCSIKLNPYNKAAILVPLDKLAELFDALAAARKALLVSELVRGLSLEK